MDLKDKQQLKNMPFSLLALQMEQETPRDSLLSALLLNGNPKQFVVDSCPSIVPDDEGDGVSSDPPASIDINSQIGSELLPRFPSLDSSPAIRSRFTLSNESDWRASPLTASSVHVMEREYERDTWRMFNRIQASRRVQQHQNQQTVGTDHSRTRRLGRNNTSSLATAVDEEDSYGFFFDIQYASKPNTLEVVSDDGRYDGTDAMFELDMNE
jgi:hypothetical protein